jgi:hypothetical protein
MNLVTFTLMRKLSILFVFIGCWSFVGCNQSEHEINKVGYSGIVFKQKPNDKDLSFIPTEGEIDDLESKLKNELPNYLSMDADKRPEKELNRSIILRDLAKYKRRYFGRITIEGESIILIEFVHPDATGNNADWKNPLIEPNGAGYRLEYSVQCRCW